jgi:hypothetical protein
MDYNHVTTESSASLAHRVERMEKRLDALVKAVDALVRQLELSGAFDEASSGVRVALKKAIRTEVL